MKIVGIKNFKNQLWMWTWSGRRWTPSCLRAMTQLQPTCHSPSTWWLYIRQANIFVKIANSSFLKCWLLGLNLDLKVLNHKSFLFRIRFYIPKEPQNMSKIFFPKFSNSFFKVFLGEKFLGMFWGSFGGLKTYSEQIRFMGQDF